MRSRKCLSKSVTEMDAYMWVTDDVLHQVRMLPSNVDDDIDDAKRILDRIHRRDLYRLVGENKITWRDQPNQEVHYNPHNFVDNVIATILYDVYDVYDVFPSLLANCPVCLLSPYSLADLTSVIRMCHEHQIALSKQRENNMTKSRQL